MLEEFKLLEELKQENKKTIEELEELRKSTKEVKELIQEINGQMSNK